MRAAAAAAALSADGVLAEATDAVGVAADVLIVLELALRNKIGGLAPSERDALHTLVVHAGGMAESARDDVTKARDLLRGSS